MESSWQSIWKGNLLKWQSPRQKAPWRGQEPSGSRANTGTHELVSLTFFGVGQRVRVTFRLAQTGPTLLTTQQNARSCRNGARLKAKFCNAEFFKALSFAGELPKKKKKTRPISLCESDGCLQSEATSPQAGANHPLRSAPCTHPTPSSTLRARRREPYPAAFVFLLFSPCD